MVKDDIIAPEGPQYTRNAIVSAKPRICMLDVKMKLFIPEPWLSSTKV